MTLAPVKAAPMGEDELAAWFDGRVSRRLLAIPFGGPVLSPHYAKGQDLDGQYFHERTDIRPDWLETRLVDWHHGNDATMGRAVLGKAAKLAMEEDGWWVDVWLKHGEHRLELVRKLVERGGILYGSSESVQGMTKADPVTGAIDQWPYWRQTLSTSPQNTLSVIRPLKAVLADALDSPPSARFWADVGPALRDLGADLQSTSFEGEAGAKSGRVLSAVNEQAIIEAVSAFEGASTEALAKLRDVLSRARKELA